MEKSENGCCTVAIPAEARRPSRFVLQLHRLALTRKESLSFLRDGLNGLVNSLAAVHHHAAAVARAGVS